MPATYGVVWRKIGVAVTDGDACSKQPGYAGRVWTGQPVNRRGIVSRAVRVYRYPDSAVSPPGTVEVLSTKANPEGLNRPPP